MHITSKTEQHIRQKSLEEIFGKLRKGRKESHKTTHLGQGKEYTRAFQFGDDHHQIDMMGSTQIPH